jgi:hypothetical protein
MTSEAIELIWQARERLETEHKDALKKLPAGGLADMGLCRMLNLEQVGPDLVKFLIKSQGRKVPKDLWTRPAKATIKDEIATAAAFLVAELERILEEEGGAK